MLARHIVYRDLGSRLAEPAETAAAELNLPHTGTHALLASLVVLHVHSGSS